ncbi:ABC-type nitrate/sulfonate/bicarbonate transport system ATPase subunit [Paenibacillus taihuensis]|uniref:ABC-type nitrate/sulfonate/bicarbonate transport system ATPase subunit n=1 Tax=Paenibacillus taihuensis TaxID=1156355 RepID=A0A3D9SKD7_9BACL|nr:ABC-type nitrate/sulfonate/bicarbonate transport system ATPase subunit [Paenibacillus taihuensis]
MSYALEICKLYKSFPGARRGDEPKQVLANVSFQVNDGEFVSVIGPSGSGKSTLFHLIGGLEKPTSGDIKMQGRSVVGEQGHIAYMPQQASLMPWLTVAGNIELALTIAGVAKAKARAQAEEWLSLVGLAGAANEYSHVLSGGMQQRVSFLRALLSPQRLMCLDEPFGALDALTRMHMQTWLLSLWEADRRSVLFVTHSIEEALLLSDRIIVLSAAPASIIHELHVPFPRPRSEALWSDAGFVAMKQQLYELLRPKSEVFT